MRAAAISVLVLLLALPASAAQSQRATLELATLKPLVVEGHGFGKREQVVLTASASNARRLLIVVARRNGSFTARFNLRLGRCAQLTVRAVGTRGSRAILQIQPGCAEKR
jgi:hypothetical protein